MLTVPLLQINLQAVLRNWQRLRALHRGAQLAAVVKADAYGLGAVPIAKTLAAAGCQRFYVATLAEAIALRTALPQAHIGVFQGILPTEAQEYLHHRLRPTLNTPAQLALWRNLCNAHPEALPAAIHVDTAMCRLGLTMSELDASLADARAVKADTLMTHYACASDLEHPVNTAQLEKMQRAHALLPHLQTSYANSAGLFLPAEYHGDIARPGCALYGINPCEAEHTRMEPVATLRVPILQCRTIDEVATLGYCATAHVAPPMRTLTVGIGYADGIMRTGSNRLYAYLDAYRLPLIGRVTMDMLCFDATHVPDGVLEAASEVTLMDARQTVDDLAQAFGTIGYEVLTRLGGRIRREYV